MDDKDSWQDPLVRRELARPHVVRAQPLGDCGKDPSNLSAT